jgi:glycogen operon protein
MIDPGSPYPIGATPGPDGTNFSVFSASAERIELCLFDASGNQTVCHDLPRCTDGLWHGFVPGIVAGQQYGYRAHGRYAPKKGQRHNPAKLLIDPYARRLSGTFEWSPAVFDHVQGAARWRRDNTDSAPFVPRSVVSEVRADAPASGPGIPWSESIFYELNVRGYTMRLPGLDDSERGRFAGLTNGKVLEYLRALGVTTVELMPVFEYIDEEFLHKSGLRNFWGYNTISFFAPAMRYAGSDPVAEFRGMVDALHDNGFEVIIDVAYNHTGESDGDGPTLSFRGLDNLSYYRVADDERSQYINDTLTANAINVDHPRVRELIIDSLRYWAGDMGVDGFRFDLATILGRNAEGFTRSHPFFEAIESDPLLKDRKFIAEPWDPGPGGYQLGHFPPQWSEWNDRYRDSLRRFWRGDDGEATEFGRRLHGSSDLFEASGRQSRASINFVTAHDGFTLADVVSYEHRHNEANGEDNRDGHSHNFSSNHGVEGQTDDPEILALRRRQRLNMLASLLLSQGVPMLLAGDEFGNSQGGNNNAYAQDNDIGWLDWGSLDADPGFLAIVKELIHLRRTSPLLRQPGYLHGERRNADGWSDIQWLRNDGQALRDEDWSSTVTFTLLLAATDPGAGGSHDAIAVALNPGDSDAVCELPRPPDGLRWNLLFSSEGEDGWLEGTRIRAGAKSLAVAGIADPRAKR